MRPQAPLYPNLYLKPGELTISLRPTLVETVLGSCVSVTLYCPTRRIGAMCHGMLPSGPAHEHKFVDAAIQHMLAELYKQGVGPATLEAKVFGGADMFANSRAMGPACFPVGDQNVECARQLLQQRRILIKTQDTGGFYGRKLLFFSDSGQVFVKQLNRKGANADRINSMGRKRA